MSEQNQQRRQVGGGRRAIGDVAPKLAALTDDVLFDDVWNRPELAARDRSLVTVAALVAGGDAAQLTFHLDHARKNGVTEAELTKAKNAYLAQTIAERQTTMGRAEALHTANMFLGGPEAVNTDLQRYLDVTVADIQRVARTYLRPENSVVTLITPETPKP